MCRRCGLFYADPLPHDVVEYYAKEYRLNYKSVYTPKPKHVLRAGLIALDRLKNLGSEHFPHAGSLLDIGAGGGEFIYLCQSLGLEVTGVEPNEGYAEYARKELDLSVVAGRHDADIPASSMDVVTMWHVLEHIDEPTTALLSAKRALKPNGTLVVEVPNVEDESQSPKSAFHPAHIFTFSPKTLTALVNMAGFEKVSLSLSPDKGNILLISRLTDNPQPAPDWEELGENGRKIAQRIRSRSSLGHFVAGPWFRRFAARQLRALKERSYLAFNGKARAGVSLRRSILDNLYRPAVEERRTAPIRRPVASEIA
ncbi:MAG: class I SAM-dependent methyltransferase [Deltaproteobacteria bacterium]|jgi:2-polyprenyl-3-methyl-5-hydroxy-6-metoxy-1,4-benzoquinol methylase|nr:class I SAM-dependent methyltransferase [Deltaproteobacteria bacterium]